MAKYKCPTLGDCDRANAGEVFERAPGEELKCPTCNTLLEPVPEAKSSARAAGKGSSTAMIAVGVIALLAAGGGGYYYFSTPAVTPTTQVAVPTPAVEAPPPSAAAPTPPPVAEAEKGTGIAPSAEETDAAIKGSAKKLAAGEMTGAERDASRAASNEMIKLAIAEMAQGKLDAAEKTLADARARDPKQSLVYYNTAILRMRQGRVDDALKEMEACFMAGFNYFDEMDKDTDLDDLRRNPRFTELLTRYRNPGK